MKHADDPIAGRVLVTLEPRRECLAESGLTLEEFEAAVSRALGDFNTRIARISELDALPYLEEAEIWLVDRKRLLGEVAVIRIIGGVYEVGEVLESEVS
jgi:hypothetical protein